MAASREKILVALKISQTLRSLAGLTLRPLPGRTSRLKLKHKSSLNIPHILRHPQEAIANANGASGRVAAMRQADIHAYLTTIQCHDGKVGSQSDWRESLSVFLRSRF